MSQVNQGSDQNIQRTFIPEATDSDTGANLVARNKSDSKNTTVPLRNITQKSQTINDQNSRRSYVPAVAGYVGNTPVGNPLAGNTLAGSLLAGTQLTRNLPVGNQMAGIFLAGNQQAGNLPAGNQLAGNQLAGKIPAANQLAGNQLARNPSMGNPSARNQLAGSLPAGNQLAGSLPVGTLSMGNPSTRDQLAGNPLAGNISAGISLALNTNNTKQASNKSNYFTNTGTTDASMFSTSSNDGPISHEDQSGIFTNLYRQPSTYDRKNTIYHQNSLPPSYYGPGNVNTYGKVSSQSSDVRKAGISSQSDPFTRSYLNYPQQMRHSAPNYQRYSSYPRYPSYQQQEWRRGYRAGPGYQVNYPGMLQKSFYPVTKYARDRVPTHQWKKVAVASHPKDNENGVKGTFDGISSSHPSTIQIKLPEKPVKTVAKSTTPRTQSPFPADDFPSSGSESSGSGFDEPIDMDDTADLQESEPELSGSGSGYDDVNVNGDISNVAFMLAGTNNNQNMPPFPVPGLPMNLTRQQAVDIYKSALYFAGLLREEGEWPTRCTMRPVSPQTV